MLFLFPVPKVKSQTSVALASASGVQMTVSEGEAAPLPLLDSGGHNILQLGVVPFLCVAHQSLIHAITSLSPLTLASLPFALWVALHFIKSTQITWNNLVSLS